MSLKRKIQKAKKKKAEEDLKNKVMSFDRMPDCCVMCYKDFDKKSREMANTWFIVERREQKRVSLFCPDCWDNGMAAIKDDLTKKQTELDKHFLKNSDQHQLEKKMAPKKEDFPDICDYVKDGVPSAKNDGEE